MRKNLRYTKAALRREGLSGAAYHEALAKRLQEMKVLTVDTKAAKTEPSA